jgi:sigma-B regulation protein RsbU (phosphoserine phosphatase)
MALSRTLIRAFAEQHRPLSWMEDLGGDEENTATLNIGRKQRRMLLSAGLSALLAVQLTNNYILDKHGDMNMFVTLFFGVLDPNTGVLTYVSGGHDPPAIIGPDGVVKTRLMPTGPAVGIFPDSSFDIEQVKLDPGDLLIGYSDGVPDAQNPAGERFSEEHFLSLLAQPFPSVTALLDHIEADLFAFIAGADQFDDITMLAVRRS